MTEIKNPLGLHKLLTLSVDDLSLLTNLNQFREFTDNLLLELSLEQVGFSSFVFENDSFTAAYCLKESHICIHTWPEMNTLTLDVYLCNYQKDNTQLVRQIADAFVGYFKADIITKHEIFR